MLKEEDIENLVNYAKNMSFQVEGCCTDNGYGQVSRYDLSLADLATVISRIERRNAAADVYGGPIAG